MDINKEKHAKSTKKAKITAAKPVAKYTLKNVLQNVLQNTWRSRKTHAKQAVMN